MSHHPLPDAGTWVLVTLPQPYAAVEAPARYAVADVRDRRLSLRSEERIAEPDPPPGVPCLVHSVLPDGRRSSCEAVVVASGAAMLVVEAAGEPPGHYRRRCTVTIEAPESDLGTVDGVLEDMWAEGLRVHTPVLLPEDVRVFVTVVLSDLQPLLAIAEVRDVHRWAEDDLVARLAFTLMAPSHRARLAALLEWPAAGAADAAVDLTRSALGATHPHVGPGHAPFAWEMVRAARP